MTRGRRHTPEQIITLLPQIETIRKNGQETPRACIEVGISEPTYYRWRAEFGRLTVDQANRLGELQQENDALKRELAEMVIHLTQVPQPVVLRGVGDGQLATRRLSLRYAITKASALQCADPDVRGKARSQ
jgi:hypothetical protein